MKLSDATELHGNLVELLDSTDSPNWRYREISKRFAEIQALLGVESRPADAEVAKSAQELASRLAEGGVGDPAAAVIWLKDVNSALEKVLSDGVAYEDAGYPATLATDDSGPADEVQSLDFSGMEIDGAIFSEFYQRQGENLQSFEQDLLNLESGLKGGERTSWMRLFHTIKSEAALLGLVDISELSHKVEDLLLETDPADCVARLINVKDWLLQKFEGSGQAAEPAPVAEIIAMLLDPETETRADARLQPGAESRAGGNGADCEFYDINVIDGDIDLVGEFIAEAIEHLDHSEVSLLTLESDPTNREALGAVFRAFHTIKGVAGFIDMDHIQAFAHKAETLLDVARKGEIKLSGPTMDITFEAVDMLKILINDLSEAIRIDGCIVRRPAYAGLMERLGALAAGELPEAVPASGLIMLSKEKTVTPGPAASGGTSAKSGGTAGQDVKSPGIQVREALRVDAERLDLLVETIGELVIAEAMVSQNRAVRASGSVGLLRDIDHLDKICRELQELGMSLRMVPVRPTFQKMARLVRDLAKKSGRRVRFETTGEDTELDKSVVDKIGDPLVHLLRNAVDHGIESDSRVRTAAGKTPEGNIELRAYHKGGNICIEVSDDGKGLNRDAILAKAVERGLIQEGIQLSDREVYNLIFEPGFSTAETVTDVSGRGVGLDVVRRNIEELRGTIDIWSVPGEGSIFSIRLPLTMAIIDGMVIRCGRENYIIPTMSVIRLVRPTAKEYSTVLETGEMLRFEDELVPMFRLNRLFDVPSARDRYDQAVVVVVESEGKRVGLMTDDLLGQQQIVIKSLGGTVQGTAGISGGAIMSDGNVALILDIAGLVKLAHATGSKKRNRKE